jgi:integrase
MRYWNAGELRQFLDAALGSHHFAAWYLSANTGMRRGEVLGLRWRDVNLEAGRLAVRRALISVAYEIVESDAKTDRSERVVDLDTRTIKILREHQARQHDEREAIGSGYRDSGLVFAKIDGSPIHPESFSQAFERKARSAGVPRIRLHDLRHTHATLLLQAGSRPRWSANGSGTRPSHSPCRCTRTSSRACRPTPRRRSATSSFSTTTTILGQVTTKVEHARVRSKRVTLRGIRA